MEPRCDLHRLVGRGDGRLAAVPPFAFFIWTLNSKLQLFHHYRNLLESLLRPLFGKWSILQLMAISLIAGISEEAFFRGAVQGSLAVLARSEEHTSELQSLR